MPVIVFGSIIAFATQGRVSSFYKINPPTYNYTLIEDVKRTEELNESLSVMRANKALIESLKDSKAEN